MRILVVGATGTIGRAVATALSSTHEIVPASRRSTPITVDLANAESARAMYGQRVSWMPSCVPQARRSSRRSHS
jgi:uncharacterized protein YbjT (DUF2867 family)